MRVRQPEWQQCWAVQMGRYAVFLPLSGDAGLYSRIEDARRNGGNAVTVTGDSYEWPKRPTFGIEQDPAHASGRVSHLILSNREVAALIWLGITFRTRLGIWMVPLRDRCGFGRFT